MKDAETPLLHGSLDLNGHKFKPFGLFWNIVKSFAGAGTFALPWAVQKAGMWSSVIGIILISLLSNYTFRTLLECSYRVMEMKKKYLNSGETVSPPSYPEIGAAAYGRLGSSVVSLFSSLMCFGVCIAYFSLIGGNISGIWPAFNHYYVILAILPICIFLSCLTDFSALSYTSIAGSGALIVAMISVIAYGFGLHRLLPVSDYPFLTWEHVPTFLGGVAFLFCDHVIILPLANACGSIRRFPGVLNWAMIFVTVINIFFACMAYAFFFNGTCGNVIDNMQKGALSTVVRIGISLEVMASFPLVANAGFNSLETGFHLNRVRAFPHLQPGEPHPFWSSNMFYYGFRASLIIVLALAAATIKQFGSLVSLVGSLTIASTGFVFPQLFYMKLYGPEVKLWDKIVQCIIVVFGVGMTILGTYQSIDTIVSSNTATPVCDPVCLCPN